MDKKNIDFICSLHGYLIRVKEIHWNTDNNAEHKLCDEIQDCVAECEDRFTECLMGMDGEHFKVGDLKPMLPNAKELIPMLKELEGEVIAMLKGFSDVRTHGLTNVLEELLENVNKFKYRATQK